MCADVARRVEIYDTTLRDGSQLEGISLTVDDKLRIAEQLDWLGVDFIEAGWPGANPKDDEFFRRAPTDLQLEHSTLVAFGSTRRVKGKVDSDETLRNLLSAGTSTVCIVGKAWDYHVLEALGTTLDEGVAMVADSVAFLHADGREVFYDAEHFFDGYHRNPEFSMRVLEGAVQAGATRLVLCDTNGGTLPDEVERTVRAVVDYFGDDVGIAVHLHDDAGTGVANALAGVRGGAMQVQGTINGYGERTGNCNLTTIIPNLTLKMGIETIPADRLERLTPVAHHVAELVNMALNPQAPYVGSSAFAHKAGLHVSAIAKRPDAYEHVVPDSVGNGTRFVVSELAGKSTLTMKAKELGLTLDGPQLNDLIDTLKRMEHDGYHFEVADASLELLMRRAGGWEQEWFEVESFRVITDDDDPFARAGRRHHRGHDQGARRRWARDRHRRGQRSGQRARHRVAQRAGRPLPGARARPPHRLQGARARHRQGHRRGHPGPGGLDERRPHVDHDRREREHHRGVVAGAL